eukprot:7718038-Alexandrium_andersonii.AAC.1
MSVLSCHPEVGHPAVRECPPTDPCARRAAQGTSPYSVRYGRCTCAIPNAAFCSSGQQAVRCNE